MVFHFTVCESLIYMTVICFLEMGYRDLTRALNEHMICHLCRWSTYVFHLLSSWVASLGQIKVQMLLTP